MKTCLGTGYEQENCFKPELDDYRTDYVLAHNSDLKSEQSFKQRPL